MDGMTWPTMTYTFRTLPDSSSVTHTTLSDTIYGFQVLFGVDYAFTEAMSIGLKGRWVKYGSSVVTTSLGTRCEVMRPT